MWQGWIGGGACGCTILSDVCARDRTVFLHCALVLHVHQFFLGVLRPSILRSQRRLEKWKWLHIGKKTCIRSWLFCYGSDPPCSVIDCSHYTVIDYRGHVGGVALWWQHHPLWWQWRRGRNITHLSSAEQHQQLLWVHAEQTTSKTRTDRTE